MLQIGEVAEAVQLSLRTIRHYDEMGVVPPSGRSAGGFRMYTDADVDRLRLVKHMKPLDFSLDEMKQVFESLDAIVDAELDEATKAHHAERLRAFGDLAEQRCQRLREQLAAGDALAKSLSQAVGNTPPGDDPRDDG